MRKDGKMPEAGEVGLAKAIISQALSDYETAYAHGNEDGAHGMISLERFFRSGWCNTLTSGIPGEVMVQAARAWAVHEEWRKKKKCHTCRGGPHNKCPHKRPCAWMPSDGPMSCPKEKKGAVENGFY